MADFEGLRIDTWLAALGDNFMSRSERFQEFGCQTQRELFELCEQNPFSLSTILESFGYNSNEINQLVISLHEVYNFPQLGGVNFSEENEENVPPVVDQIGDQPPHNAAEICDNLRVALPAAAPQLEKEASSITISQWLETLDTSSGELLKHLSKFEMYELTPRQLASMVKDNIEHAQDFLSSIGLNVDHVRLLVGSVTPHTDTAAAEVADVVMKDELPPLEEEKQPQQQEDEQQQQPNAEQRNENDASVDTSQFLTIRQWLLSLDNGAGKYLKFSETLEVIGWKTKGDLLRESKDATYFESILENCGYDASECAVMLADLRHSKELITPNMKKMSDLLANLELEKYKEQFDVLELSCLADVFKIPPPRLNEILGDIVEDTSDRTLIQWQLEDLRKRSNVSQEEELEIMNSLLAVVKRGEEDDLKLLDDLMLQHFPNIDKQDKNGDIALVCASASGNKDMVEALIQYGPDVNVHDKKGMSPILAAIINNHDDVVCLLVRRTRFRKRQLLDLEYKYDNRNAVEWAAEKGLAAGAFQMLLNELEQQRKEVCPSSLVHDDNARQINAAMLEEDFKESEVKLHPLSMLEGREVLNKFLDQWNKVEVAEPQKIVAILKIENQDLKQKFDEYKTIVRFDCEEQGVFTDNFNLTTSFLFHGTSTICGLHQKDDESYSVCSQKRCAVCSISKSGFLLKKFAYNTGWGRFGRGLYFAENSSKAHDYTSTAAKRQKRRVMFVVDVITGKVKKLSENSDKLETAPERCHSVYGEVGGDLRYSETVVYSNSAVIPTHCIIYEF